MSYSYEQILQAQYQRIAEEQSAAVAELEAARIAEDALRVTSAADRILDLDKSREALDRRAHGFVAAQQAQPQSNRFGLNQDELDIAKASGLTDEQYAQNKAKLRHMRATGQYRDDQGTVSR